MRDLKIIEVKSNMAALLEDPVFQLMRLNI